MKPSFHKWCTTILWTHDRNWKSASLCLVHSVMLRLWPWIWVCATPLAEGGHQKHKKTQTWCTVQAATDVFPPPTLSLQQSGIPHPLQPLTSTQLDWKVSSHSLWFLFVACFCFLSTKGGRSAPEQVQPTRIEGVPWQEDNTQPARTLVSHLSVANISVSSVSLHSNGPREK